MEYIFDSIIGITDKEEMENWANVRITCSSDEFYWVQAVLYDYLLADESDIVPDW